MRRTPSRAPMAITCPGAGVPAGCSGWVYHLVDTVLLPAYFELHPSAVHPSEISAGLDRSVPYATVWLYNDLVYFRDADYPYTSTYRWQRSCYGTTCYTTNSVTGVRTSRDMRTGRFSGRGIQWTVLGEKHDVTVVKRESRTTNSGTDYDWTGYGGWATYNAFFARWQEGVDGVYDGSGQVWSYSAGQASNSNPPYISARWDGFMAGVDIGNTSTRGNSVLGKAAIVFDGGYYQDTVDVHFTEIIDAKTLDRRADMRWYNLAVWNGSFGAGTDTHSIQGQFYGRYHQEVGGIFERNRIQGAFGATR